MERVRASQMGVAAVNSLLAGETNKMIGIINGKITKTPFEQAIKGHQPVDQNLQEMASILSSLA